MPKTTLSWLFALAILCGAVALDGGSACLAAPNDTIADRVLGQGNFNSHGVNIAKPNGMYSPEGIAVNNSGAAPHHLYVADTGNSRVLGWHDAASFANGAAPDVVIGQPSSTSIDCGLAINRLCSPRGLAVDGAGHLFTRLEACHWFRFPDLPAAVSLRSCCDALNLDPHRISRTALRWAGLA